MAIPPNQDQDQGIRGSEDQGIMGSGAPQGGGVGHLLRTEDPEGAHLKAVLWVTQE
jgi:hypothetical protein